MLGGLRAGAAGTTRIAVNVTFLRMDRSPDAPAPKLPSTVTVQTLGAPTVAFYRFLYATVGGPHCWWLRRITPDNEIAALLASPAISIHVLYRDGEPGGFYELDARTGHDVNLAYFGLMPHLIGKGLGEAFLRHAIDAAWMLSPNQLRVNTCTADHPRALPAYLRAGFKPMRTVREMWDIPDALGMPIPATLRA